MSVLGGGAAFRSHKGEKPVTFDIFFLDIHVSHQEDYKYNLEQEFFQMGNRYVMYPSNYSISVLTEKNGLSFIETSALDSTNVEAAFQTILTGESSSALCFKGEGQKSA